MDTPHLQFQGQKKDLTTQLYSAKVPYTNPHLDKLEKQGVHLQYINGLDQIDHSKTLKGNIENFIGYVQVPVGLAGPLLVKGSVATGNYHIPMATTEGALVASYGRGMKACSLSGGVSAICIEEALQRAPYFKFSNLRVAIQFVNWAKTQLAIFKTIVRTTSNYCRLVQLECIQEGNAVTIVLKFTSGDAAGQNMVTIASDAICKYILEQFEETPQQWYIESNYAGDKKPTMKALMNTRGKKVIAEVTLPRALVRSVLKTTPEKMCQFFQTATLASLSVGAIGNPGHIANGLTAIYLACGQDVACVAESSVGILRMEMTTTKALYVSLTLPALVVGTVGGGTQLPTQAEGLRILACEGAEQAKKFAEICCATALAGELSIAAAIAEDHFTSAHKSLGRK